jgi:hypothetical protein
MFSVGPALSLMLSAFAMGPGNAAVFKMVP